MKDNSNVANSVDYGVASISSWSKSKYIPEMGITRIRGPPKTTASFWRWTPWRDEDKLVGTYLP